MNSNEKDSGTICVRIRTSFDFKRIFGKGRFEVETRAGSTLGEFLHQLVDTWGDELATHLYQPDGRALLPHLMLMVNGQNIHFLNRLDTVLQDEDEVLILPPVVGG